LLAAHKHVHEHIHDCKKYDIGHGDMTLEYITIEYIYLHT